MYSVLQEHSYSNIIIDGIIVKERLLRNLCKLCYFLALFFFFFQVSNLESWGGKNTQNCNIFQEDCLSWLAFFPFQMLLSPTLLSHCHMKSWTAFETWMSQVNSLTNIFFFIEQGPLKALWGCLHSCNFLSTWYRDV